MSAEREHSGVIQYSAYAPQDRSEALEPWPQIPPERSTAVARGTAESWPSSPESRRTTETLERVAEHPYPPALLTGEPFRLPRPPVPVEDQGVRWGAPAAGAAVAESSVPPPNHWPELLDSPPDSAGELVAALRALERLDRLNREQRGE